MNEQKTKIFKVKLTFDKEIDGEPVTYDDIVSSIKNCLSTGINEAYWQIADHDYLVDSGLMRSGQIAASLEIEDIDY